MSLPLSWRDSTAGALEEGELASRIVAPDAQRNSTDTDRIPSHDGIRGSLIAPIYDDITQPFPDADGERVAVDSEGVGGDYRAGWQSVVLLPPSEPAVTLPPVVADPRVGDNAAAGGESLDSPSVVRGGDFGTSLS